MQFLPSSFPILSCVVKCCHIGCYLPFVLDVLNRNNDDHNHESDFISNSPAMVPFDFHLESLI